MTPVHYRTRLLGGRWFHGLPAALQTALLQVAQH
jgi:hypothetical protein